MVHGDTLDLHDRIHSGGTHLGREASTYRILLAIGGLAFGILLFVSWGLRQTLQANDGQTPRVQRDASPFDAQRAYEDVHKVVEIGPRVAGTQGGLDARTYITQSLKVARVPFEVQEFEAKTPMGSRLMANVVAKVTGTTDGIILLGNHYDTKYLPDMYFVGANDGGSTTGWMLEMARILGGKREGHSVWLCFFDGEEAVKEWTEKDSLYGSRAFADQLEADGVVSQVKAMINVDMIGDCKLGIQRDVEAPGWLLNTVGNAADKMGYSRHFLTTGEAVLDDHIPFRKLGIPSINLIDFRYGGSALEHEKNWHTSRDSMELVCAESLQVVGDVVYHAILTLDEL